MCRHDHVVQSAAQKPLYQLDQVIDFLAEVFKGIDSAETNTTPDDGLDDRLGECQARRWESARFGIPFSPCRSNGNRRPGWCLQGSDHSGPREECAQDWLANLGECLRQAHEIRNPLGSLALHANAFRTETRSINRPSARICHQGSDAVDAILTEFLRSSPAGIESVGIYQQSACRALDLIQHEARSHSNISIVTPLASASLAVRIDQNQMRQVFWNLATNAFQAMPKGGQLTISTGCRQIDLGARKSEVIEIAFQDQGEGIPPDNLDKISSRSSHPKRRGRVWDWPRFIVSRSARRMDHRSKATGNRARALWWCYASLRRRGAAAGMRTERRGKIILVVDDEKSLREVMSIMLKRAGYAVTEASDGEEAIGQVGKDIFDLVITDLRMPKADGMDVLKAVKSSSPETVVLVVTAFATADSAVER